MAIFEKTIQNKKFDQLLWKLENEIPASSWSAELEAGSDFKEGDARCSGSQAMFFKVNTLGEESFLEDVKGLLEEILEE